jgi:uncharacterized protein (DUF1778 family)
MKQRKRLRREITTSIRFSERERDLVQKAADLSGQPVAEFCRVAITGEAILLIQQMKGV